MIESLSDVGPANLLSLLYGAIASAYSAGAILGIAAVWLSVAMRGGDG